MGGNEGQGQRPRLFRDTLSAGGGATADDDGGDGGGSHGGVLDGMGGETEARRTGGGVKSGDAGGGGGGAGEIVCTTLRSSSSKGGDASSSPRAASIASVPMPRKRCSATSAAAPSTPASTLASIWSWVVDRVTVDRVTAAAGKPSSVASCSRTRDMIVLSTSRRRRDVTVKITTRV